MVYITVHFENSFHDFSINISVNKNVTNSFACQNLAIFDLNSVRFGNKSVNLWAVTGHMRREAII